MIIQHNISAINSHRQLGINNNATAKNLEKLSSGYRINRAGDDAAGLAISEKMRGQIRGLAMAEQNCENGISLIQTAEGGLNETHAILQRMRELAVQASNGTYDDEVDRANIDKEITALKTEIDRIASSTHYNGINLLDGTMGAKKGADNIGVNTTGLTFTATTITGTTFAGNFSGTINIVVRENGDIYASVDGEEFSKVQGNKFADKNGVEFTVAGLTKPGAAQIDYSYTAAINSNDTDLTNAKFDFANMMSGSKAQELVFQIGANGTADQQVGIHVDNMSSAFLGDDKTAICDISLATREQANDAIKVITAATNQVSGTRADLGALQNRLEHTLNNLGVTKENLTAAESTIRDVDMAKEMMEFTKNNILVQASQAMLAQANQLPQGVLQLLR